MKGFFITGTDTGVGKTYVSRLIADTAADILSVTYFKPVQSGGLRDEQGRLHSPDFQYVMAGKALQTCERHIHVPYLFEPACSPHLAAEMSHTTIDLDHIMDCYRLVAESASCVLVEGAGGLYVPLNGQKYIIDIIGMFDLPVVLVTTPKLGTLNHTFLSVNALRSRGHTIAAVIYNTWCEEHATYIRENNKITIERTINPVPLIEISAGEQSNNALKEFCNDMLKR